MEKSYKYLGHFFLLLIPLSIAGFYKTYIVQFPHFEEGITVYIHLHAIIACIWIILLMVQPFLIRYNKVGLHRILGKWSYFIFPLLILSFVPQTIRMAHSDNPRQVFFPLADGLLLTVFYCMAIYTKKKTALHMRYMIVTALVFLGPTVGRIGPILLGWGEVLTQNVQYGILYVILVGLWYYDKVNGKNYPPYLTAVCFYAIHQILYHLVFLIK